MSAGGGSSGSPSEIAFPQEPVDIRPTPQGAALPGRITFRDAAQVRITNRRDVLFNRCANSQPERQTG
jgi:hypothetical protein